MPTHTALLRGINVGGHNKIAMADLRGIVADLGHTDVATYVQSGNVVFTAAGTDPVAIADGIRAAITERTGLTPAVLVLSRDDVARAIADNPYKDETDPKALHAVLLPAPMKAAEVDGVEAAVERAAAKGSPDEASTVGRVLYLHLPGGIGRSDLAAQLGKAGPAKKIYTAGTARNWRTVTTLLDMLDG